MAKDFTSASPAASPSKKTAPSDSPARISNTNSKQQKTKNEFRTDNNKSDKNLVKNCQQAMTENVFIRVPILIGYVRIITALLSFYYMPFAPGKACFWYIFSTLSDTVDGLSARWLKQESRVGKLFDMLTDRCSTASLIIVLSQFYPKWAFPFQMFVTLDVCSHWLFVYDAVLHGSSSHKAVNDDTPAILRLYYSSRPILFLCAGGTELFFILLYGLHFSKGPMWYGLPVFTVLLCICTPVVVIKVVLLVVQMADALRKIAEEDVKETKKKQREEAAKVN